MSSPASSVATLTARGSLTLPIAAIVSSLFWLGRRVNLDADSSRKKITDRHSPSVGPVQKHRIAGHKFCFHRLAAGGRPQTTIDYRAAEF
jgi:hypothetical protein